MSSGMTVCMVVLHAAGLLCSLSAISLIADCLTFRVSALMAFFWRSAAAAAATKLYRSATELRLSWGCLGGCTSAGVQLGEAV